MLPEKWIVRIDKDINHPALKYLQNKYYNISPYWKYYGENKNKCVAFDYFVQINKDYTILTTEQFLEMTTEQEVWKKGDIIYSKKYDAFRKIFSIIDNYIIFCTNVCPTLERAMNSNEIDVLSKDFLKQSDYKLYNSENPNVLELTLEEIAQRFNVNVKDLKIKK